MKYGIMTYHNIPNFGAILQAYSLCKVINELGYECDVIDYECQNIVKRELEYHGSGNAIKLALHRVFSWPHVEKKILRCQEFDRQYYSKEKYTLKTIPKANKMYDGFISGSDIIWNLDVNGYDYSYFLDFANEGKKKIAYGSSIGDCWKDTDKSKIKNLLEQYDAVSVREEDTSCYIREAFGLPCKWVADPTMLLPTPFWESCTTPVKEKEYVIVYFPSDHLIETAKEYFSERKIVTFEDLAKSEPDYAKLGEIRSHKIDTDPLYINFTSGSTGTPKGIVVCHRSVIDFIDHFTEIFGIGNNDVIANQAPFDFDVSVKDIYSAVKTGATLVVVPRRMFSAPAELIDFICDRRITVMIWAVSALCLISTFHALDYRTPETVNKILFSGEVMPLKALKNFRSHLPNAKYVNLYGPTEITCNCTYHILDNDCDYADGIPIGKPFPNEDVILLDENNNRISEVGKVGEICVRGTALALGYYSNPEQNAKAFVQNPLNPYYPELIYRTGDLARYNENGELVFSGRKDFQIKYMGHRIELEEIEREMSAVDGVEQCCCIFDEKKSRLKGFFVGSIEKDELAASMSRDLPAFMIPGVIRKVDEMPLTKNGKIDRKKLAEIAGGRRK